jgi:hypothetical protein
MKLDMKLGWWKMDIKLSCMPSPLSSGSFTLHPYIYTFIHTFILKFQFCPRIQTKTTPSFFTFLWFFFNFPETQDTMSDKIIHLYKVVVVLFGRHPCCSFVCSLAISFPSTSKILLQFLPSITLWFSLIMFLWLD